MSIRKCQMTWERYEKSITRHIKRRANSSGRFASWKYKKIKQLSSKKIVETVDKRMQAAALVSAFPLPCACLWSVKGLSNLLFNIISCFTPLKFYTDMEINIYWIFFTSYPKYGQYRSNGSKCKSKQWLLRWRSCKKFTLCTCQRNNVNMPSRNMKNLFIRRAQTA